MKLEGAIKLTKDELKTLLHNMQEETYHFVPVVYDDMERTKEMFGDIPVYKIDWHREARDRAESFRNTLVE